LSDYYDAFAAIYDKWAAHMTEDVAWYVELAREADGPVVELAVGNGRVAVPVAQALGRPILGIDLSGAMLEGARQRAEATGVELELRQGDMRELELAEPAALIYCPFRSLLHLPTWADKRRVFERVYASLRPGGRFAWNAFVFSPQIAVRIDGVHQVQAGIGHVVYQHPHDNRLDIVLDQGGSISLWWVTKSEWEGLVDVSGLEVEALYGGFAREPFGEASPEFVWVARRPL
jgi:ubiquinone/menaquinone biosynthesis C-methylase UbiE